VAAFQGGGEYLGVGEAGDNDAVFEFIMNFILDAVAVRPPKRRR
jgi:hypothetical protein